MKLEIKRIGNSTGIILPKELLLRLRLQQGDVVTVTETPDGLRLSPYSEEIADQLDRARAIAHERRNVLRVLAQ